GWLRRGWGGGLGAAARGLARHGGRCSRWLAGISTAPPPRLRPRHCPPPSERHACPLCGHERAVMRLDHSDDALNEVHEINVTPFIDVMLVLLIIFMVAAPLATVDIKVNLPALSAE